MVQKFPRLLIPLFLIVLSLSFIVLIDLLEFSNEWIGSIKSWLFTFTIWVLIPFQVFKIIKLDYFPKVLIPILLIFTAIFLIVIIDFLGMSHLGFTSEERGYSIHLILVFCILILIPLQVMVVLMKLFSKFYSNNKR